jgi:uncharacterized protein (UPF0305 family)
MSYQLEKSVWTDSDFDAMGWHDATLWSTVAIDDAFEYLFDLDYIFQWVDPEPGEKYFSFWVAPVTMVFHNVHHVRLDIDSLLGTIEVADLHRNQTEPTQNEKLAEWTYRVVCQEGEISLVSTGYTMYVRKQPIHQRGQRLDLDQRGGISFARPTKAA